MAYEDYAGRTETRADHVSPWLLRGMAATLGTAVPDVLPPLWHWMLFQDWVPAAGLGPDGHPKRGGFLPPVHDLPRRMWAGGRVRFLAPLRVDTPVERVSTILAVSEKSGGSGRLVFVTVRHSVVSPDGVAIEEEQDIVYRGAEGAAVKPAPAAPPAPPGTTHREVVPDPVLLFRYSALTGNGHRIHYDMDYVRHEEGYPGLVVHGPLQATWLAMLLAPRPVAQFSFRGRRPTFHDVPLRLEAWTDGPGFRLRTLDPSGAVCMEAEATLAGDAPA